MGIDNVELRCEFKGCPAVGGLFVVAFVLFVVDSESHITFSFRVVLNCSIVVCLTGIPLRVQYIGIKSSGSSDAGGGSLPEKAADSFEVSDVNFLLLITGGA